MAVLSKHGEIGQIQRVAYRVAYCEDGQVLRNDGDGWKTWKKIKPGINPRDAFQRAQAAYAEKLASRPAFAAWRKLFHETFSPGRRSLALQVIDSMPQDPDGVWSELNDYAFGMNDNSYGIDEVVEVCRAYQAAEAESKAMQLEPVAA